MEFFMQLFPGIGTFFAVEPVIAVARIVLIVFGFVLACLGFKRTLEPLILSPMLRPLWMPCRSIFSSQSII